jgi:hypothetical protein
MEWTLTKGLQNLINQVNARWPDRDKSTDGTVGDANHASGTSGHNPDDSPYDNAEWDGDADNRSEVRAWDMDADLREPGTTTQQLVDHIRHLPNVGSVLRYIIFDRKIYHSSVGFAPEAYTGPSPHTGHVHFSGARSQASDENTTFDFKLEEVGDMGLTEAQTKAAMLALLRSPEGKAALAAAAGAGVHDQKIGKSAVTIGVALQTVLARSAADDLDEAEVARLVLAGLPATELVKAMTDAQASATADLLAARMKS